MAVMALPLLNGEVVKVHKYAQIVDNRVHTIIEHEATLAVLYEKYFNKEQIFLVDITDKDEVREGWLYDGAFSKPAELELTLEERQEAKWIIIKKDRENQKAQGFLFNGERYDGDEAAQTNIANAALTAMTAKMAGQALTVAWTTFHNTVVALTAEELLQLQATMTQTGANIQAYGTLLRNQINAATSQEQLDAIVWEYDETQNYF